MTKVEGAVVRSTVRTEGGTAATKAAGQAEASGVRINQGPYNPRVIESQLRSTLQPGETMTSSTLLGQNERMVHMAGKRHPVTGVVYDTKGYPIFDDVAVFDMKLPSDVALNVASDTHKAMATKQLAAVIEANPHLKAKFNDAQLSDIVAGKKTIEDYIWHHHQDIGRMQLISRDLHVKTGHVGENLWRRGLDGTQ